MDKPREHTTLLLDGDVFAFIAAAAAQRDVTDPEDGMVFRWSWPAEAEAICDNMIYSVRERLKADDFLVFLSDPVANWRNQIFAGYKDNRKDKSARPQLLSHLKDHMRSRYLAIEWPGMEADDLLGIYATHPELAPEGRRVIVSKDKDMKTIPGLFCNLGDPKLGVQEISEEEADFNHLVQAFAGDVVDAYPGCTSIGPERARAILQDPKVLVPREGYVTRGIRKGERTVAWWGEPTKNLWDCIVSHYQKAGLDEAFALTMARVARICRSSDYDLTNNRVILWTPTR